jgi:hypothetical protein
MGDDELQGRDRDLYERLRAKGVGRKLARRIAGAPDVERGGRARKRTKKAAKKAARRLARDGGAPAQAAAAAEPAPAIAPATGPGAAAGPAPAARPAPAVERAGVPVPLPPAPEQASLPPAGGTSGGTSPTEGPLRAAVEAAGVGPRAPGGADEHDPGDGAQAPAPRAAWRRRTATGGRAPAMRRSTGGGRGARRRRRAGGSRGGG